MLDAILSFACDLDRGVERTLIRPALLTGDSQAHTFRLTVTRGGGDADIAGASVAAYFVRGDGVTVPITGSVEGSVAVVTLPEGCYRVPGRFQLVVKLSTDSGISTVFWGDGAVASSSTDTILDEEGVIPSLDEVLAQIAATEAAAENANSAAEAADTAASRASTATNAAISATSKANAAAASIESIGAEATTLAPGSAATAAWSTVDGAKVLTIGVPQGLQGEKGDKGDKGDPGADGTGSVSTVNGVEPVQGNVTLTAEDVGALTSDPREAGETSPELSGVPINADSLGGFSLAEIMLKLYPVGAIYTSTVGTSPSTLFGGTWEQLQDRFLLAAGSTYGAGSTGGEAEHTLTVDEMPSHRHSVPNMSGRDEGTEWVGQSGTAASKTRWSDNYGGGQPHNNMPPYLAVYMWKRVS